MDPDHKMLSNDTISYFERVFSESTDELMKTM